MRLLAPFICFILVACNGGGGGSGQKVEGGDSSGGSYSYSILLVEPASIPSLDSTPTIRISGVSPDESIGVFSDSSCTSPLATGLPIDSSIELTLSALPVGETSLYV